MGYPTGEWIEKVILSRRNGEAGKGAAIGRLPKAVGRRKAFERTREIGSHSRTGKIIAKQLRSLSFAFGNRMYCFVFRLHPTSQHTRYLPPDKRVPWKNHLHYASNEMRMLNATTCFLLGLKHLSLRMSIWKTLTLKTLIRLVLNIKILQPQPLWPHTTTREFDVYELTWYKSNDYTLTLNIHL